MNVPKLYKSRSHVHEYNKPGRWLRIPGLSAPSKLIYFMYFASSIKNSYSTKFSSYSLPPPSMPRSTIHARVLNHRVGIACIPLDRIDMHEQHRPSTNTHVLSLKEELAKDINSRWAHPIDLVISDGVTKSWIKALQTNRLTLNPPASGRFVCIGGQHRLLASRRLLEEWEPSEESPEIDPSLAFYPATIYEAGK